MQISTILKRTVPAVLFCTIIFQTYRAYTHSSGAQASCTNAPGESTCAQSGCHTDKNGGQKNLFTKSSDVVLSNGNGTSTYIPGATYTMKLTCNRTGHKVFGFQVTALSSSGNKMAGTLSVTNSTTTQSITGFISGGSRTYIEQTSNGTSGSGGTISWSFKWVAPKPAVGNVVFYGICNASNDDGTDGGDTILAQTFTFTQDTILPVAKFSFTPANPCTGDKVHFFDSSSGSPTSWSWTFQNGTPSTSLSQNPTVIFASGGNDSVTLTATNAVGASVPVKRYITVNPRSGDTILVKGNDTICSGSGVSLVAPFGLSYKWSTGDTTQTITATSSGTYTVSVSNGYCITSSIPVTITVLQKPVVSLTKSEDTACSGDSVTFTATSGFSIYTFYKNGQKVQLGISNTYTAVNIQQGDSFSATASNSFGCQSDMSAKVNVALPILPTAAHPSCNVVTDSSITFTWPALADCDGYQVSADSGKNWLTNGGNADTSYTLTGLSYDTYVDLYVRGYNHSKCSYGPVGQTLCKTLSCSNITYSLKYDSAICTGGLVSLHFSNISISNYSISINGSTPVKDTFFQVAPDANSQIQISIKDSSSICPAQKDLLAIDVHKIIKMQLQCNSIDSTYCFGGDALLTATNGFDQYAWYESINGSNFKRILPSFNVNKIDVFSLSQTGTYIFKIVGTNNYGCGSDSAFKEIIFQAPLKPFFSYSSNGLVFTFKDSSADYSRIWYFGDGDTGINALQTHTYTLPDKYKVTLKTFSPVGCSDTLSEFVDVVIKSGIETYNSVQDVNIYPNPSPSSFSISFSSTIEGAANIKVLDMNGKNIVSKQIKLENGQNSLQVDLSNSPQGFYFMQIITSDGVNTFKLIKD